MSPARLILPIRGGRIVLEQELGMWSVIVHCTGKTPLVFASGLPLAHAQEHAEDLARRADGRARYDERN